MKIFLFFYLRWESLPSSFSCAASRKSSSLHQQLLSRQARFRARSRGSRGKKVNPGPSKRRPGMPEIFPGLCKPIGNRHELTFSAGGKTTRGWQATLDRYVQNYAPPKEMGTLTFDHLETTLFEKNAALILGDWHLKMEKGENRNGNFSLVLRKIQGEWRIIHDHSSTLEKEPPDNNE